MNIYKGVFNKMSEDIHKWTDGRYTLMFDEHTFFVFDNEKEERMTALETTKRLNKQQSTIQSLNEENEQLRTQLMTALSYVPIETRVDMLGSLKRSDWNE